MCNINYCRQHLSPINLSIRVTRAEGSFAKHSKYCIIQSMHIKYGKSVDSWYNNDRGIIYLQRQVNHGIVPQKHTQTVRIIIVIMYV